MIKLEKLTKVFDGTKAVDDITLEISQKNFGIIGPNGAGKTTLLLMLSTLLPPSQGRASIKGFDVVKQKNEIKKLIGIVFQEISLDDRLSVYENLEIQAVLHNIPKGERRRKIKELLGIFGLEELGNAPTRRLSGGTKRRVEIARAVLHEPEILFLDEPTLGLDPNGRETIWSYIESLKLKGVSIVLTTNYMEEAERLCSNLTLMSRGKMLRQSSVAELKKEFKEEIIEITSKQPEKTLGDIRKITAIKNIKLSQNKITGDVEMGRVKEAIEHAEKLEEVEAIEIRKPTLDELFIKYFGGLGAGDDGER